MMPPFSKEVRVCTAVVRQAAIAAEQIQVQGAAAVSKADGSPLTQADIVSQAIILMGLRRYFPEDRIFAEEELVDPIQGGLREAACRTLREMGFADADTSLEDWVNFRGTPSGKRIWMVDPIDGTKGFKKGLSYAVAVGLYVDGRPRFGCLAVPRFPSGGSGVKETMIAYGGGGLGAYRIPWAEGPPQRLWVSKVNRMAHLTLAGSRAHDPGGLIGRFTEKAGIRQIVRMDGQGKYLLLASGAADVYLREADSVFGIGYLWDHCAGHAILEEAGGRVTGLEGEPLSYEQDPKVRMTGGKGLLATNSCCHEKVLDMIRDLL